MAATPTPTPEQLLPGLVGTESSGREFAVSPKGAIGYTQITPALAKQYGYKPSDISDPGVQWDIYRRHMGHLLEKYHDTTKALAAWNTGEANVDRGRIPAETRAFVPKVLSKTPGAGLMAQYQYSASTNTYWMKGPGGPIQVPADQVPADVRAATAKRFGGRAEKAPAAKPSPAAAPPNAPPAKVPATPPPAPAAPPSALKTGVQDFLSGASQGLMSFDDPGAMTTPQQGTAEERYEKGVGQLPGPAQLFVPQTLGEATASLARADAPESYGASLLIPAGIGAATGYLEPGVGPDSPPWLSWPRAKRAGIEAGKEVLGQAGTRILTGLTSKSAELIGRYKGMPEMIDRMTSRVGQGIEDLFNHFPLAKKALKTVDDITYWVSNGRLKDGVGSQIDRLTDEMESKIPEYHPGAPAPLTLHGAGPTPPSGEKFELPDVDPANNTIVMRTYNNVRDAINHIKKLNNTGFGKSGPKGGSESFLYRDASHQARDIMRPRLNQLGQQYGGGARWGDQFAEHNADYGTANILEKNTKGTLRTARIHGENKGILDQPTLAKKINKEMPDLRRLHPNAKPDAFQRAISPTLGTSTAESFGEHPGTGLWEKLLDFLGAPYMPETREVMPQPYRALSSQQFQRVAPRILTTPAVAAGSNLLPELLGAGQPATQKPEP